MKNFFKTYKKETIIFFVCFATKLISFFIVLFLRFKFGDWEFLHSVAEPSGKIFSGGIPTFNFHEPGDFHPPLYYFFTASVLTALPYEWVIYLIQGLLISIAAVFVYKTGKMVLYSERLLTNGLGEKIAFWSAILFSVEPYLSFETNTLGSDVLGLFFFVFFSYFFIKYFKEGALAPLYASASFLGLATLTRPGTLYLPVIIGFFFLFFSFTARESLFRLLKHFLVFTAIFMLFIAPWIIINKIVYNEFVFSRLSRVNFYPYNAATFVAAKERISFGEARTRLEEKARQETEKSGEPLDDYYAREAFKIIFSDPIFYAKVHLIKSVPFLLQPGYEIMLHGYGVPYKPDRPDLTLLFMQRNFSAILKFITNIDFATTLYLLGIMFWGILNILFFAALARSFRNDKFVFLVFLFFGLTILYHAALFGTIAVARYRLPLYFMFFLPAFYVIFSRKNLSAEN